MQKNHDVFESRFSCYRIPYDDYRFVAILKLGPLDSRKDQTLKVHVLDSCNVNGVLLFPMKLLHASQISASYPQFETTGLLGWWKLISSNKETWITLDTPLWPKTPSDVQKYVLDNSSATFVRKRYESFFASL